MGDVTGPREGSQRCWWQLRNPLEAIDFSSVIDELWSGVILGGSKYKSDYDSLIRRAPAWAIRAALSRKRLDG